MSALPIILFVALMLVSTIFGKRAEQARKRHENDGSPSRPPSSTPSRSPNARIPRPSTDEPTTYASSPLNDVDLIRTDSETRYTADLAEELVATNHHLAKQMATLQRWNRGT